MPRVFTAHTPLGPDMLMFESLSGNEQLSRLRRKLDRAVEREDFERAAQLRDQIRDLEGARP